MSRDQQTGNDVVPGNGAYQLRLIGAFGLCRPDGSGVHIRHLKNQALLALLATAPGQERTRRWLEATLWSDRQPKEAGQSLRTALSELRRVFGANASPIAATRATVSLIPGMVGTDLSSRLLTQHDPEVLEGLDIRDEAFNDWLTLFRAEKNAERAPIQAMVVSTPYHQPAHSVVARIAAGSNRFEAFLSQQILDLVDQNLSETIGSGVTHTLPSRGDCQGVFILRSSVLEHAGHARISLRLEDPSSGTRLWTGSSSVPADLPRVERNPDVLKMIFGTSSAVIGAIQKATERQRPGQASAEALLARAIVEMFSFDAARMQIAEELLKASSPRLPRPLLLAWEALLSQFKHAEVSLEARPVLKEQAVAAADEAVAEAPDSSQVLALAGIVYQFLGASPDVGFALGDRAVFQNPGNAFAHAGLGISCLRQGKVQEGTALIERAEHLASHSVFLPWIQMFRCLSAIKMDDFNTAVNRAEAASARVRSFRSPLRHLYALHLLRDDRRAAQRVLGRLRHIEPGFSMQMIRSDPGYPVPTLRSSPLIDVRDLD